MKDHLQFHWWKYLALALLPILLWIGVFQILAQPKAHQRVNVLYIGSQLDTIRLQWELKTALPELTQQQILSAAVNSEAIPKEQYFNALTARCFDYDLIIIEEDCMRENIGQAIFVRLLPELTEQLPNALPYEETAEDALLTFGYILYDGQRENLFSGFYSGNQKCYAFISPESVNFDTLNEKGNAGDDAALKALRYLMEKPQ